MMNREISENVVGYRLDRKGRVYAQHLGGDEREVVHPDQKIAILVGNPDLGLSLSNKG